MSSVKEKRETDKSEKESSWVLWTTAFITFCSLVLYFIGRVSSYYNYAYWQIDAGFFPSDYISYSFDGFVFLIKVIRNNLFAILAVPTILIYVVVVISFVRFYYKKAKKIIKERDFLLSKVEDNEGNKKEVDEHLPNIFEVIMILGCIIIIAIGTFSLMVNKSYYYILGVENDENFLTRQKYEEYFLTKNPNCLPQNRFSIFKEYTLSGEENALKGIELICSETVCYVYTTEKQVKLIPLSKIESAVSKDFIGEKTDECLVGK